MNILDLLFPKRCVSCGKLGAYICEGCFKKIEIIEKPICPVCQRQAIGGKTHPGCQTWWSLDGLVVVCRYQGPVKTAIAKVKYKWVYDIGKTLVDLISKNLWRYDLGKDLILVPIPLHNKRKNWRGFNQAEILARDLAEKFQVRYSDYLVRIKETKTQVGLDKKQRKENIKDAFSLNPIHKGVRRPLDSAQGKIMDEIRGRNIILVDDVYTSGATMAEAARVLKRAGAKSVWGMAVALG